SVKALAFSARSTIKSRTIMICSTVIIAMVSARPLNAQSVPYQRTFPQSKAIVAKRLQELQSWSAGHLPTLEGFAVPGDRPWDRFHRGYYQCAPQVSATSSGGSTVRVNATITAWYTDPVPAKSGYQILPSNGRLEADFLDRLQEALGGSEASSSPTPVAKAPPSAATDSSNPPGPSLSAPPRGDRASGAQPKTPSGKPFNLGDPLGLNHMSSLATQKAVVDRHTEEEAREAKGLEEILRNQAHPTNLVAVKKGDTPVLASPIADAKVLFLAAAEDEFEILDANPNWVHIRISGISRGWIRRSSLEMPSEDPDPPPAATDARTEPPAQADTQPFHVENEQVASFPGNWQPLQGKTVRIVSVQKTSDDAAATGSGAKLALAKSLFDRQYADLVRTSSSVVGVVVIFDSDDGGMIAATVPALRQWKSGTLSDEAFWRRCFFDPPEAFGLAANP
ncbi:MAG: hypothetical protein WB755_03475, partial [Terriglobales bacterium]